MSKPGRGQTHTCRSVVQFNPTFDDCNPKDVSTWGPKPLTEDMLVRCGKIATRYQEGCYDPEDGWTCDDHYMTQEEFDAL